MAVRHVSDCKELHCLFLTALVRKCELVEKSTLRLVLSFRLLALVFLTVAVVFSGAFFGGPSLKLLELLFAIILFLILSLVLVWIERTARQPILRYLDEHKGVVWR